jgi:hypothetical protein
MLHEICQKLDDISERLLEFRNFDNALAKELSVKVSNLLTQITVQKGFDEIARLVREEKTLPVRRISFNIKKLSESSEQSESRWSKLQKLNFQTLIFCTLSFAGLMSMQPELFGWLVEYAQRYLRAQALPRNWVTRDQIRKVIANTPRRENTKAFLESLLPGYS